MNKAGPGLALTASALACWRISHLVAHEDGPFDVVLRVRAHAGPSHWGRLMDCPYCLSIWAAAPLAGWMTRRSGWAPGDAIVLWLAISGAASVLERVTASHNDSAGALTIPAER